MFTCASKQDNMAHIYGANYALNMFSNCNPDLVNIIPESSRTATLNAWGGWKRPGGEEIAKPLYPPQQITGDNNFSFVDIKSMARPTSSIQTNRGSNENSQAAATFDAKNTVCAENEVLPPSMGVKSRSSASKAEKRIRKPRYAFQTKSQVDILDDGYRWRKYGQKAVKNNRFPRSYYRCTHQNCKVKKQVQRLTEDQSVVVTTYDGIHTHPYEKTVDDFDKILSQLQFRPDFM